MTWINVKPSKSRVWDRVCNMPNQIKAIHDKYKSILKHKREVKAISMGN